MQCAYNKYFNKYLKQCSYSIFLDSDAHDSEPSENLLELYNYKLAQLRDITNKVYNADDHKRLSVKLAKENRAHLTVCLI